MRKKRASNEVDAANGSSNKRRKLQPQMDLSNSQAISKREKEHKKTNRKTLATTLGKFKNLRTQKFESISSKHTHASPNKLRVQQSKLAPQKNNSKLEKIHSIKTMKIRHILPNPMCDTIYSNKDKLIQSDNCNSPKSKLSKNILEKNKPYLPKKTCDSKIFTVSPKQIRSESSQNISLAKTPKSCKPLRKTLFNPCSDNVFDTFSSDKSTPKAKADQPGIEISPQKPFINNEDEESQTKTGPFCQSPLQKPMSQILVSPNHRMNMDSDKIPLATPKRHIYCKKSSYAIPNEKSLSLKTPEKLSCKPKCNNIMKSIRRKYSPNLKKMLFNPNMLESPSKPFKRHSKPKLIIDFSDDDESNSSTPQNTSKGKKSLFTPFSVDSPNSSLEMSQNNDRIEKRKRHKNQIANIKRTNIYSHSTPARRLRFTSKRSDKLNISDTKLSELYRTSLQITSECSGVTNAFIDLFTYIKQNPDQVDMAKSLMDTKVNSSCGLTTDIKIEKQESSPKKKSMSKMIETNIEIINLETLPNKFLSDETNNEAYNFCNPLDKKEFLSMSLMSKVYGKVDAVQASNSMLNQSIHDGALFIPLDYDYKPSRKLAVDIKVIKINHFKILNISTNFKRSSSLEPLINLIYTPLLKLEKTPINNRVSKRKKKK